MGPTRKPNGPVWNNKYGKPLRCEDCGRTRCRGTRLCKTCNAAYAKTSIAGRSIGSEQ